MSDNKSLIYFLKEYFYNDFLQTVYYSKFRQAIYCQYGYLAVSLTAKKGNKLCGCFITDNCTSIKNALHVKVVLQMYLLLDMSQLTGVVCSFDCI